jgi:hypothetical protein
MLFKDKKPTIDVSVFRKSCMVIESCKNYEQLKNGMNYVNLYYSIYKDFETYQHLQKLISKKLEQVNLNY